MSDLTKALMGYEETPFGYATESAGRACPVSLDTFRIDEDAKLVIIPTPKGGVMGTSTEAISLKQWLGLGWRNVILNIYLGNDHIVICREYGEGLRAQTTHRYRMSRHDTIWAGLSGIVLSLDEFNKMIACFEEQDNAY